MALRISSLTFVGFYINSLLHDHPGEMQFDEIYQSLERRSILEELEKRYPGETDFSLFSEGSEQRTALLELLHQAGSALEGREHRKVGVERCGLNLLMAIILEAIQQLARQEKSALTH